MIKIIYSLLIKMSLIFFIVALYTLTIASTYANSITSKPKGVCVFDIDFTLKCDGSYAAVAACKEAGFELAINTARGRDKAYEVVEEGLLLEKGFDQYFVELARMQYGLYGPFQYKESWGHSQPEEQIDQAKSYGMRNIARYYNLNLDDIDSRKIILFDDMLHNIVQMQPNHLDPYRKQECARDYNGECFNTPSLSPDYVAYPRNWKIYRSKWVGYMCTRWHSSKKARSDAMEMINKVLSNSDRESTS